MLGAILGAGASLVSGLFGRSDAKKQARKEEKAIRTANEAATAAADKMNRELRARGDAAALVPVQRSSEHFSASSSGVNMDQFMADAEKYGFNPLTYLRSGALAMYGKTESYSEDWDCVTGERAMDAAQAGSYIPQLSPVISGTKVPSVGSVFADAAMTGVNQYLADKSIQDNNKFQMDLLNRQLEGANRSGSSNFARSFYSPSATISGPYGQRGGGALAPSGQILPSTIQVRHPDGTISTIANPDASTDPETDIYRIVKNWSDRVFDPLYGPTSSGTTRGWDWLISNQGQGWDILPDWPGSYGGRGNMPAPSKQK